jgi:hypothetical protein
VSPRLERLLRELLVSLHLVGEAAIVIDLLHAEVELGRFVEIGERLRRLVELEVEVAPAVVVVGVFAVELDRGGEVLDGVRGLARLVVELGALDEHPRLGLLAVARGPKAQGAREVHDRGPGIARLQLLFGLGRPGGEGVRARGRESQEKEEGRGQSRSHGIIIGRIAGRPAGVKLLASNGGI